MATQDPIEVARANVDYAAEKVAAAQSAHNDAHLAQERAESELWTARQRLTRVLAMESFIRRIAFGE